MSFYFTILGTKDQPLFTHIFGTSRSGGDGIARFPERTSKLCPFIAHSALDLLDEAQWSSGQMYLKTVDRFQGVHVSGFVTGASIKFLLLSTAEVGESEGGKGREKAFTGYNPNSPQTEEAMKSFFLEVYEVWTKNVMNPFYFMGEEVRSAVFRGRVAGAARKYL